MLVCSPPEGEPSRESLLNPVVGDKDIRLSTVGWKQDAIGRKKRFVIERCLGAVGKQVAYIWVP